MDLLVVKNHLNKHGSDPCMRTCWSSNTFVNQKFQYLCGLYAILGKFLLLNGIVFLNGITLDIAVRCVISFRNMMINYLAIYKLKQAIIEVQPP